MNTIMFDGHARSGKGQMITPPPPGHSPTTSGIQSGQAPRGASGWHRLRRLDFCDVRTHVAQSQEEPFQPPNGRPETPLRLPRWRRRHRHRSGRRVIRAVSYPSGKEPAKARLADAEGQYARFAALRASMQDKGGDYAGSGLPASREPVRAARRARAARAAARKREGRKRPKATTSRRFRREGRLRPRATPVFSSVLYASIAVRSASSRFPWLKPSQCRVRLGERNIGQFDPI